MNERIRLYFVVDLKGLGLKFNWLTSALPHNGYHFTVPCILILRSGPG